MSLEVNLFTAVIVLIVGLYDMAYAFNRRYKSKKGGFGPLWFWASYSLFLEFIY